MWKLLFKNSCLKYMDFSFLCYLQDVWKSGHWKGPGRLQHLQLNASLSVAALLDCFNKSQVLSVTPLPLSPHLTWSKMASFYNAELLMTIGCWLQGTDYACLLGWTHLLAHFQFSYFQESWVFYEPSFCSLHNVPSLVGIGPLHSSSHFEWGTFFMENKF